MFESDFKDFMVNETMVRKVYANELFKNDSNDFISNIKETIDVTLATDDDRVDRHLEVHDKSFTNQEAFNFKVMLP